MTAPATGHVAFKDIPDAFTDIGPDGSTAFEDVGANVFDVRKCNVSFSVAVEGLEYLNAENIAVTVLR